MKVFAERVIVNGRYALVVFYMTGIAALVAYVGRSSWEAIKFVVQIATGSPEDKVIGILGIFDALMVANVIYLIVAGSYLVYVEGRFDDRVVSEHKERPPALQHLTSGSLKEKMAASLIGVSSVNLLTVLLRSDGTSWQALAIKTGIHVLLIVGMIAFYIVNKAEEQHEEEDRLGSRDGARDPARGLR